jgi:DNA helicase-2/ATP-dependent DNA helicase PcrA
MKEISEYLKNLSDEQRIAVTCTDRNVVCVAGAGTGKTHTLISRICHQVNDLNTDPTSILCLTFTRNAAFEFESRYKLMSENKICPTFGTFHQFCYKLLSMPEFLYKFGYSYCPLIIDESQDAYYKDKAKLLSSCKLSNKKLSKNYVPTRSEKFQYDVFFKCYSQLLKKDNVITFDSLSSHISSLFDKNDPICSEVLSQYRYVYVDEFQDTDPSQWAFVRSFCDSSNIFVVGDPYQSIYSFRGASPDIMRSLINNPSWTTIRLSTNYRSTQEICDFVNNFVTDRNDPNAIKLKSDRHGQNISFIHESDISKQISKLSSEETAVLFRTNEEVRRLSSYLESNNVSFTNNQSNQEEVIQSSLDEHYFAQCVLAKLPQYVRRSLIESSYVSSIDEVIDDRRVISLGEIYCKIFFDDVNDFMSSEEFNDIRNMYMNNEFDIDSLRISRSVSSLLYIGTIHSVKGLQFKNVIVASFESIYKNIDRGDNRNLLYVACTRAEDRLYVITD